MNITIKRIVEFWKTIKAFLTSKKWLRNSDIMPINNKEMVVTDDKKLATSFNEYCIDNIGRYSGLNSEKTERESFINTNKKVLESVVN